VESHQRSAEQSIQSDAPGAEFKLPLVGARIDTFHAKSSFQYNYTKHSFF